MSDGLCCLTAHANAKAPWTCPCKCHTTPEVSMSQTHDAIQSSDRLKSLILSLCDKADEVIQNGDWPTEDGTWIETNAGCTCPLNDIIVEIREALGAA